MTKEELRELAQWGMRKKLREIEEQLEDYRKEFPDLFVSDTKVVLLKAEAREGGASAWAELPALPKPKLLPTAREPLGPTHKERLLAHIAEHPLMTSAQLARALDIKVASASSSLWALKKQRKVWQPEEDARWALRQKIKAVPVTASAGRPAGQAATASGRILALLRETGQSFRNGELAKRFKTSSSTVDSALIRARKRGEVVWEDGRWRATTAPRTTTAAPRAQAPDAHARRHKSPKGGPRRRFWKERWYSYLQAHGPAPLYVAAKALNTGSAMLFTTGRSWLQSGILVKTGDGDYAIGKVKPDPAAMAEAAQYASQNGGARA